MNTITGLNPICADSGYAAADNCSYAAARVSQTEVAGEQSTDITIVTDEKDKVTLSFDLGYQSSYTTYSALATNNNASAKIEGQQFDFDLSLEQSIRVEGDLNEQELKDIKKVLKRLGRMIKNFLAGGIDDASHRTGRLFKNLSTIDSVAARFEVTQRAAVVDQQYVEATALSTLDGDRPVDPQPSSPQPAQEFEPIHELTDDMVDVVKGSRIHPAKMTRFIDRFFHRLFENSRHGHRPKRHMTNLARLILSEFMQKLQDLSANTTKASASSPSD